MPVVSTIYSQLPITRDLDNSTVELITRSRIDFPYLPLTRSEYFSLQVIFSIILTSMARTTYLPKWDESKHNPRTWTYFYLKWVKFSSMYSWKYCSVVPHQELLYKLSNYGINTATLTWLKSFLSNRKQRVVLEGAMSWLSSSIIGSPTGLRFRSHFILGLYKRPPPEREI